MTRLCQLILTCADQKIADKIAEVLLHKRLVASVRRATVRSAY